ncbi:hypothetical protein JXA85_07495 [Candidatus Woesearchaeota archaeon]|nr:hypothetical protein [Candidatus Woesearchaeota archaeon]
MAEPQKESDLEKMAKGAKTDDKAKQDAKKLEEMTKKYQEAYSKSKPSGLSKFLGFGLAAAATYFGGPLIASFGPTAKIATTIGSYLGVASQYVSYGLAALTGGALGYSIPTSMSRAANASKYMQQIEAKDKKEEKPYNKNPAAKATP